MKKLFLLFAITITLCNCSQTKEPKLETRTDSIRYVFEQNAFEVVRLDRVQIIFNDYLLTYKSGDKTLTDTARVFSIASVATMPDTILFPEWIMYRFQVKGRDIPPKDILNYLPITKN